jgi:hypothetical protein
MKLIYHYSKINAPLHKTNINEISEKFVSNLIKLLMGLMEEWNEIEEGTDWRV